MRWEVPRNRSRHRRDPRNQSGAALLLALGSLFMVSIVAVAVASFTQTVGRATVGTIRAQAGVRQFDGYLEKAVREYRLDPAAVGADCSGRWATNPTWLPSDFSLTCASTSLPSPAAPTDGRHATIKLLLGTRAVGMASIRVEDKQGSAPLPGSTLTVCAWQITNVDDSLAVTC